MSDDNQNILHIGDVGSFRSEVFEAELPVVVDFWADWCGPCRAMAPIFADLATQFEGRARFVKVDTERAQEVARAAGVRSLPTFGFYWKGELRDVMIGAQSPAVLQKRVQKMVDRAEGKGFLERLFKR